MRWTEVPFYLGAPNNHQAKSGAPRPLKFTECCCVLRWGCRKASCPQKVRNGLGRTQHLILPHSHDTVLPSCHIVCSYNLHNQQEKKPSQAHQETRTAKGWYNRLVQIHKAGNFTGIRRKSLSRNACVTLVQKTATMKTSLRFLIYNMPSLKLCIKCCVFQSMVSTISRTLQQQWK